MTAAFTDEGLPEFDAPPVVEVVLGVQFRPLLGLRPIELGPLREAWRPTHPVVQEQPLLPPAIEGHASGPRVAQFVVGPALNTRLWFLSEDTSSLVQLQHDRLTVNWRQMTSTTYPRYRAMRDSFAERSADVVRFTAEHGLGRLSVTQAEVSYINAIDATEEELGDLGSVLRHWREPSTHLGRAEQARCTLVFPVPDIGRPPVRLYIAVDPAQRPEGTPSLFLTLTVRGDPGGDDVDKALRFMDQAHAHVVRSFAELTPDAMHAQWGRRR